MWLLCQIFAYGAQMRSHICFRLPISQFGCLSDLEVIVRVRLAINARYLCLDLELEIILTLAVRFIERLQARDLKSTQRWSSSVPSAVWWIFQRRQCYTWTDACWMSAVSAARWIWQAQSLRQWSAFAFCIMRLDLLMPFFLCSSD